MRRLVLVALAAVLLFAGAGGRLPVVEAQQPGPDRVRVFIELPDRGRPDDQAAVRSVGGQVRHSFPESRTISVELPEQAVAALERASNRFVRVYPVPMVEAFEDSTDWGVRRVDASTVWGGSNSAVDVDSDNPSGEGVKVAVLDTGSGPHNDFNVVQRIQCITPSDFNGGCSTGGTVNDDHGHGTHVAGTIAANDNETGLVGVAPDASLYSVKVLAASGNGYMDDIAAAINWAAANDMDVVSMSLGCYGSGCDVTVVRNAVENAYDSGVLLVAAAGNSGTCAGTGDQVGYPAKYPDVIAVGATDSNNSSPCWSSVGPAVEIAAPGASINSTYLNNGYRTMSGTSMATPHVSGVAALLMSCDSTLSNSEVRNLLNNTATDLGSTGRDTWYGFGLVQADAAIEQADCADAAPSTPAADFNLSCNPTSITVESGKSGTTACTVTAVNGFTSSVDLSCSGLSNGTCSFSPDPVTPTSGGANSTLTLTGTGSSASSDSFTVSGAGGGLSKSVNMTLNVTAPASPPPSGGGDAQMYFSVGSGGSVGTETPLSVTNEDIVAWNGGQNFEIFFDGSDVGLSSYAIDAFDIVDPDGEILFSFSGSGSAGGVSFDDSDVLRFEATTLGSVTAGTWSMYFDASDVGLSTSNEDIDAIQLLPDGRLLVSTTGSFSVPSLGNSGPTVSGTDADLIAFTPNSEGIGDGSSSGSWAIYFDGSDVSMSSSSEDIDALAVKDGKLYLSTTGSFSVSGRSGSDEDVFVFTPSSTGGTTAGTFSSSLFFDGSQFGMSGNDIFAIDLP